MLSKIKIPLPDMIVSFLYIVASTVRIFSTLDVSRCIFFRKTVCFLQNAVLALDSSTLDIDQVENLIKFCPTKEEMETLKVCSAFNYYYYSCNSFLLASQVSI